MSRGLAPPPSPVVEQVYRHRQMSIASWNAVCAFFRDLAIAALLLWEFHHGNFLHFFGLKDTPLSYVTLSLLIIFLLSALVDLARYLYCTFSTTNIEMNDQQRRLLAVDETEVTRSPTTSGQSRNYRGSPVFSMVPRGSPMSNNYSPSALLNGSLDNGRTSIYNTSYTSPANLSTSPRVTSVRRSYNDSLNSSARYPSPVNSSFISTDSFGLETLSLGDDGTAKNRTSTRKSSPRHKDVMDMRTLETLLNEESLQEQQHSIRLNEDVLNAYSQYYQMEMPRFPYQVACRSPQSVSAAFNDDDSIDTFQGEEIWHRLGVGRNTLDVWIERLRRFLSQTIMARVSAEISKLNKQLRRLGLDEMEIGEVSIATLKQIANTKSHQLQTLHSVIPFLDLTANQQYLVARIHELGKGGCMSDFNWRGGMEYKSKAWSEHLPTDCAIVVHCLCTYLDARLPPHPKFPDGRTFTSQHFLKVPEKPKLSLKNSLIIYQSKLNPPHFKIISGNDILDVSKGRNNMFQSILLFLYFIKTKDGMLDRVSLGMSGINILWVLDEEEKRFQRQNVEELS